MANTEKIQKLRTTLNSPSTPEAYKPRLRAAIEALEKEDMAEKPTTKAPKKKASQTTNKSAKSKSYSEMSDEEFAFSPLGKIVSLSNKAWDKTKADSGSQLRTDNKMLIVYVSEMEQGLKELNIAKNSLGEDAYDKLVDDNEHLLVEFLTWNDYFDAAMTPDLKTMYQKLWDAGYISTTANPTIITIGAVPVPAKLKKPRKARKVTSEIKKYYAHRDIKTVTVLEDGKKATYKGADVLNGANFLAKGGILANISTYVPVRNIVEVELEDGSIVKPANGYHIKDAATPITKSKKVDKNDDVTPKKALELMKEGYEIRVRGYDDDYKNFTGVSIADYDGWEDDEIIETLAEYLQLQSWNEKYKEGGEIKSDENDFDLKEFLEARHSAVEAIFKENGMTLSPLYRIKKGDNEYFPTVLFSRVDDTPKSLVIGYWDKNDITMNSIGEIEFELQEKEFHVRFPHFKINDVKMYAKGGWTNDHKQLNKGEDYEVTYNNQHPRKLAEGGEVDLFETPEDLPAEVLAIMDKYANAEEYSELEDMQSEIEAIGYTFDFGLDAVPHNLRKISELAKGGWTNDHRQLNKGEDYEVRYNKQHPRKLEKGGEIENIGRLAKGKTLQQIADIHNVTFAYIEKQMNRGAKVEMEHTTDENIARTIAKDHLFENPDYYIMLSKMEKKIEPPKKLANGGPVWEKLPTKKVRGVYSVKGNGIDTRIEIVGFEKYNQEEYSLYQGLSDDNRVGPKAIHGFMVKSNTLNKIDKGESITAIGKDEKKYKIQRLGSYSEVMKPGEYLEFGGKIKSKKVKDPNRKGNPVFELARKIRKPGQNWQEAIQDAKKQLREEKNKS